VLPQFLDQFPVPITAVGGNLDLKTFGDPKMA